MALLLTIFVGPKTELTLVTSEYSCLRVYKFYVAICCNRIYLTSPIPQLDRIENPKNEPNVSDHKPIPDSLEPLVPLAGAVNPVSGYCLDKQCIICLLKMTIKIGDFFACFLSKDNSKCCNSLHWQSRN